MAAILIYVDDIIFEQFGLQYWGSPYMSFAIGLNVSEQNDKNGDGFDDDSDHDGYAEVVKAD